MNILSSTQFYQDEINRKNSSWNDGPDYKEPHINVIDATTDLAIDLIESWFVFEKFLTSKRSLQKPTTATIKRKYVPFYSKAQVYPKKNRSNKSCKFLLVIFIEVNILFPHSNAG